MNLLHIKKKIQTEHLDMQGLKKKKITNIEKLLKIPD